MGSRVTRSKSRAARAHFFGDLATDDILLNILIHVPRKDHQALACVCRRWKDLVSGSDFLRLRKQAALTEPWLYIFGSWLSRQEGKRGVVLNPTDGSTHEMPGWAREGTFSDFACTSLGTKIYVIGGVRLLGKHHNYSDVSKEVQVYDVLTRRWSEGRPMLEGRAGAACAALGSKVYVFGGVGESRVQLSTCEVYDAKTDRWTATAPLPFSATLYNAQVVDNKILMLQSQVSAGTRDVFAYRPDMNAWQLLARLPFPMLGYPGTLPLHGKFALVGGTAEHWLRCSHRAVVWDEQTRSWRLWAGHHSSEMHTCPFVNHHRAAPHPHASAAPPAPPFPRRGALALPVPLPLPRLHEAAAAARPLQQPAPRAPQRPAPGAGPLMGLPQSWGPCSHGDCAKLTIGSFPFMIGGSVYRVRQTENRSYGVEVFERERLEAEGGPWRQVACVDDLPGRPRVTIVAA